LTSGRAAIWLEHQALRIEGGREAMDILALNIEGFAAEGGLDSHLHIEYLPGHDYLARRSKPLVVTLHFGVRQLVEPAARSGFEFDD
jgi:hypothetical protein